MLALLLVILGVQSAGTAAQCGHGATTGARSKRIALVAGWRNAFAACSAAKVARLHTAGAASSTATALLAPPAAQRREMGLLRLRGGSTTHSDALDADPASSFVSNAFTRSRAIVMEAQDDAGLAGVNGEHYSDEIINSQAFGVGHTDESVDGDEDVEERGYEEEGGSECDGGEEESQEEVSDVEKRKADPMLVCWECGGKPLFECAMCGEFVRRVSVSACVGCLCSHQCCHRLCAATSSCLPALPAYPSIHLSLCSEHKSTEIQCGTHKHTLSCTHAQGERAIAELNVKSCNG